MSKVLTCPVKRWPGTVTLPDWYDWGQLGAWEEGLERAAELKPEGDKFPYRQLEAQGAAILPMVEEWHLEGIQAKPERLPGTPIADAVELHAWLMKMITAVIQGDEGVSPFLEGGSTAG